MHVRVCAADSVIRGIDAYVLPFTAGGFIYISLVNIVPTLFEESAHASSHSVFAQTVLEVAAMCAGIGLMWAITLIEGAQHSH